MNNFNPELSLDLITSILNFMTTHWKNKFLGFTRVNRLKTKKPFVRKALYKIDVSKD